ncbi:mRNA (guanine-N7-)-methyltransferase [Pancytospora philotis]|nr:mRNA (guanine-N7-)-methyltransferase [Pancytospora philotis]
MDDQQNIRSHYNARANKSVQERQKTKNINIRNLNNLVKTRLISEYTRPHDEVLDLGVGKGGDLGKYRSAQISLLYGIDIANRSILDATERARAARCPFKVILKTRDAYAAPFNLQRSFNVVSAQFSFHYSFPSKTVLDTAIENIRAHLQYNGYFILTTLDKDEILRRRAAGTLSNSYYRIEFRDEESEGVFGQRYYYTLVDSVDACVEYLVDMEVLEQKFARVGIRLVEKKSFSAFLQDVEPRGRERGRRGSIHSLNREEREVVDLHLVAVFQKRK